VVLARHLEEYVSCEDTDTPVQGKAAKRSEKKERREENKAKTQKQWIFDGRQRAY
jgi:hypothetical protein